MMRTVVYAIVCIWFSAASLAQPVTIESAVVKLLDEAELATQEPGLLTRLLVEEGQQVKQGDLLAVIDDRKAALEEATAEIELALAQTEAQNDVAIRFAEKAHEVARAELARSQESIAQFSKSVSQSQVDVEKLTVEKLLLEIEQARHEQSINRLQVRSKEMKLRAAQLDRERRQLTAPIDGIVVEVRHTTGEWIEPGTVLVRLVNIDRVKVEGLVTAEQATALEPGTPAAAVATTSDAPLSGRLQFVSPEIDPIKKQVRVWAEIDNSARRLRPGQAVALRIDADNKEDSINGGD